MSPREDDFDLEAGTNTHGTVPPTEESSKPRRKDANADHQDSQSTSADTTLTSSPEATRDDAGSITRLRTEEDDPQADSHEHDHEGVLHWRERVRHFTWTWFTMTMATGQLASVLYKVPYRFHGLYAIGCIFFLLNIVLFIFNIIMISLRFYLYPKTFMSSLRHPTESLFAPAAVISIGTIFTTITEYGWHEGKTGPWIISTMVVLFWIYCGLALAFTCGIYLVLWSTQTFTVAQMTPVWIFPAYPLLVIGPHAGVLSQRCEGTTALNIIIGGFVLQGIGFMISLMIYSAFLYRLMTQKLPMESSRPAMFISVGPSGFTVSGVVNMGARIPAVIPADFMGVGAIAGTISMIMANWMGLWLWGLAIFFFLVSFGAHWSCIGHGRLHYAMTWYSFIFPNTGLTNATFAIAKALNKNKPINILGCVMTCLLVAMWMFVFSMMIRAVFKKEILWPQKQEDRDEGGYSHVYHKREKNKKKIWKSDRNQIVRPDGNVEQGDEEGSSSNGGE